MMHTASVNVWKTQHNLVNTTTILIMNAVNVFANLMMLIT
jgi:hypothetical protein